MGWQNASPCFLPFGRTSQLDVKYRQLPNKLFAPLCKTIQGALGTKEQDYVRTQPQA
jgi:hypothetical protein